VIDRLRAAFTGWIEDPNPILLKELRATFRTAMFVRFLYIAVGLVSLLVLAVGAVAASGELPPATVGQVLFQLFFGATLFVICLIAPGYAATAITAEREQRTWESLQLSGMNASRIVRGKFFAAYASIALVIVSLAPVSGIGFLFGGVSPTQVVVGLLSMLVALAPAIAFGIALSARLPSTRLAIVLATLVYLPMSFVGVFMMTGFGDVAHREWQLSMQGPFFYTDAFTTRADEWDTWAILLGGTVYAVGMPVWFLLASAIAGVRPAAENRAAPLKRWAVVNTAATAVVCLAAVMSMGSARDMGQMSMVALSAVGMLLGFYALLFANEPPLPPRPYEVALQRAPIWRRALALVGPGAAGTLRFDAALIVVTAGACFAVTVVPRHALHPLWEPGLSYTLAAFAIAAGLATVALFGATFGALMRLTLRHGLAARVVTSAVIAGLAIGPFMLAMVLDPHSLDRLSERAPLITHFSAIYPLILGAQLNDLDAVGAFANLARLSVPCVTYGLLALACWATVEARVRRARRAVAARRARFAVVTPEPVPPPPAQESE